MRLIFRLVTMMGVLVIPFMAFSQITIECLNNEEITAPYCYDCTDPSDTVLFTGFRIIESGVDTTMIESPWRLKVRKDSNQWLFFDYRDRLKFGSVSELTDFSTLDELITYVKDCQSFVVDYAGDSTVRVHWGDTMKITYPEGGGGGPGDTTYYWIRTVNGGAPDTITIGETENLVESGEIDITQGANTITFFVPDMRDTCIHTLSKLDDTTAALYDCNGVLRGTAAFSFDTLVCQDYAMVVANGPPDTIFFNKCNGVRDTIVVHPFVQDDKRLDSIGVYTNDSIAFVMRDSAGNYDTLYAVIPIDSINTDTQELSVNGDSLFISNANGVDLNFLHDTIKRKPFHVAYYREDSILSDTTAWDSLVMMNLNTRWLYLNDSLRSMAFGKGARADNYFNVAIGPYAFPFAPDTIDETVSYTQIDTQNNRITGLSTYITHLGDLGYQVGDVITVLVSLNSGEMPFVDTAQGIYWPQTYHQLKISSSSTLDLLYGVQFDSAAVGEYTFTVSAFVVHSTALGDSAIADKSYQIALGQDSTHEVKMGLNHRIRVDTGYLQNQVMKWDTLAQQFLPGSAALQTIVKTGKAVLLSDATPNDTIADLEDESVVYWNDGDWRTDSLYFRYSPTLKQVIINQPDYVSGSYSLGITGGLRIKNNAVQTGTTRIAMISDDYDLYAIQVGPISGGRGDISIVTPSSTDATGALTIENDVAGNAIHVYNEERIGLWTSTTVPSYPLQLNGDFWIMPGGTIRDINEEIPSEQNSILSGGTGGGLLWKKIHGVGGVSVSADEDTITIDGSGTTAGSVFLEGGYGIGVSGSGIFADPFVISDTTTMRVSNDTLYHGDEFAVLPQGADSLGTAFTDNYPVVGDGTRGGKEISTFFFTDDNTINLPGSVLTGEGVSTGAARIEFGNARTGDGNAYFDLHAQSGSDYDARVIRYSGANGLFQVVNNGTGGSQFYQLGNAQMAFATNTGNRLVISGAGAIQFNAYNSTNNTGTPTYILGTDGSGNVVKRSFANVLSDIGAQPAGSYDNYQSFNVAVGGSWEGGVFSNNITPGSAIEGIDFFGTAGGAITIGSSTTAISGENYRRVSIGVTAGGINSGHIGDATIQEVDLGVTNLPTDNYILTYDNGSGGFTWVDPSTLSGGSGIYGGSGTVGGGSSVTASVNSGTSFQVNYNSGVGAFGISGATAFMYHQSGVKLGDGDDLTNELLIDAYTGGVRLGNENASPESRLGFDSDGDIHIVAQAGTNVADINMTAEDNITITTTDNLDVNSDFADILGTSAVLVQSSGSVELRGPTYLGNNTDDQLYVETTNASNVKIGHEDNVGDSDESYIQFYDASTLGQRISIVNTAGIIRADATVFNVSTQLLTGANVTAPIGAYALYVSGTQFSTSAATFSTSDSIVKRDIVEIKDPFEKINKLRPVTYRYKEDYLKENRQDDYLMKGFIAQDYEEVFPEDVITDESTGRLAINSMAVAPYTVAAVQQLIKDNQQQAAQIKVLMEQINKLYDLINKK